VRIESVHVEPPLGESRTFVPLPVGVSRAPGRVGELLRELPGPDFLRVRGREQGDRGTRLTLRRPNGPDLDVEIAGEHELPEGSLIAAPVTRDWWTQELDFVEGDLSIEPVPGTEHERDVEIPLLRLHRPHHEGCLATYALGHAAGRSEEFTFSIIGFGIGTSAELSATDTDTYTADKRCIEVVTPARVATAIIVLSVIGVEVDRRPAARVIETHPGDVDPRPLARADDGCQKSYDAVVRGLRHWSADLRGAHDPGAEHSEELERKTTSTLELEVPLAAKPDIKVKLGLERTTSTTTTLTTTLVQGARYTTYDRADGETMERCWSTK